jgi:hypothetical protein
MQQIKSAAGFAEYVEAAGRVWSIPQNDLVKVVGKGSKSRTMAHISVAIYVAEQMSPVFHAHVIKTFLEGKLLEFREMGGTEFKNLNAAIDLYLPGRQGADNMGIYIQAAKLIRAKLLGADATAGGWAVATAAQTLSRYEAERALVQMLSLGLVKDWEHLKDLIAKV